MLAIGSPSHNVSAAELRNSRSSLQTLQRPALVAPWGDSITQWCLHVGISISASAPAAGANGSTTMMCPPRSNTTHPTVYIRRQEANGSSITTDLKVTVQSHD